MLIPRSVPRRIGEVTDRDTTHMPALRPVSRVSQTVAEVVGAATLALFTFAALVVIFS